VLISNKSIFPYQAGTFADAPLLTATGR
jgi:hypothetical protein